MKGKTAMGGHHSTKMGKDEWITPPEIIRKLGPFDLDPCAPIIRPWDTAANHFDILDDGLSLPWFGFVWCNPPYGNSTGVWLNKLAEHGNGIALIFARTETEMFVNEVWGKANGLLFIFKRLTFHHVSGELASHNAGAPSVLVGYGAEAVKRLSKCDIPGKFIYL